MIGLPPRSRMALVLLGMGLLLQGSDVFALSMTGALQIHSTLHEPFMAKIPLDLEPGRDLPQLEVFVAPQSDYVGTDDKIKNHLTARLEEADELPSHASQGKTRHILISGTLPESDPFFTLLVRITWRDVTYIRNFSVVLDAFPTTRMEPVFPVQPDPPAIAPVVTTGSLINKLYTLPGMVWSGACLLLLFSGWWAWGRWRDRFVTIPWQPMVQDQNFPIPFPGAMREKVESPPTPVLEVKSEPIVFEQPISDQPLPIDEHAESSLQPEIVLTKEKPQTHESLVDPEPSLQPKIVIEKEKSKIHESLVAAEPSLQPTIVIEKQKPQTHASLTAMLDALDEEAGLSSYPLPDQQGLHEEDDLDQDELFELASFEEYAQDETGHEINESENTEETDSEPPVKDYWTLNSDIFDQTSSSTESESTKEPEAIETIAFQSSQESTRQTWQNASQRENLEPRSHISDEEMILSLEFEPYDEETAVSFVKK